MDVTDVCDGKQPLALRGIYQTSHCSVMEACLANAIGRRWIETIQ